jgi:hypothetical protein
MHREHASQSGMKEERFVISHQKVTELQIDFGNEDRETAPQAQFQLR